MNLSFCAFVTLILNIKKNLKNMCIASNVHISFKRKAC